MDSSCLFFFFLPFVKVEIQLICNIVLVSGYSKVIQLYMCVCVCVCVCVLSHSWIVAHQAPLSMEISRQRYWSGLQFSSPRDLPDPGIKPVSLASPALAGFFTTVPPGKPALSRRQKHKNRHKLYY